MSSADILDKISSILFIMGTIFSKLRLLPFALFSLVSNIISQILYCVAYVLWFAASYLYPDHPRLKNEWYGFGQFKEQSRISAAIGTIGSILSVIAIAYPVVIVPALWLFVASNIIWSISHYHMLRNPPDCDKDFSSSSQTDYIGYTILTTLVSLVTACCITVSFLYPPLSFAMLVTSTLLGLLFTLIGLNYLVNYTFSNTKENKWNGTSYENLSSELSVSNTKSKDFQADSDFEMAHDIPSYPPLFSKSTSNPSETPAVPTNKIPLPHPFFYPDKADEHMDLPDIGLVLR